MITISKHLKRWCLLCIIAPALYFMSSAHAQVAPRIVNGTETVPYSRTYQAHLTLNGSPWCGGTLISDNWVLTAAHCMDNASTSSLKVWLGAHDITSGDGVQYDVSQIIVNPGWSSNNNDIALIRLSTPASTDYKRALLPTSEVINGPAAVGQYAVVSGWGNTSNGGSGSDVLLEVSLPIISNAQCSSDLNSTVNDNYICGGYENNKSACNGDSGGPFVVEYNGDIYSVGTVSWGLACASSSAFARTSYFLDWIAQTSGVTPPGGGSSSGGSSSGGSSSGGSSSGGSSSGGLSNGQTITGISASQGNYTQAYYIDVPSGASNLKISISGGSGDADLYVKKGSEPTDSSYDCRPYDSGNNETCGTGGDSLPTSQGRFYIKLKAYSTFSGVGLTASYTGGGSSSGGSSSGGSSSGGSSGGSSSGGSSSGGSSSGGSSSGGLSNGQTVSGLNASQGNYTQAYYIDVPSGASNLKISISGGSGDADLYVKKGSEPTDSSYDCRPYDSGNNETCGTGGDSLPTSQGRFYIKLKAYSTFSGVSLTASYTGGGSSSGGSSSGGSSSGGSSSGGSSSGGSSGGGNIVNACASESPHTGSNLTSGDAICVPNGSSAGTIQYYYIQVPANTSSMTIRTQHGSGNGNLYYNASTWATSSAFTQSSTNAGNTESITVSNPANGYRFISVIGQQSGMSLLVEFQ